MIGQNPAQQHQNRPEHAKTGQPIGRHPGWQTPRDRQQSDALDPRQRTLIDSLVGRRRGGNVTHLA
jgi:hypothetical protein